MWDSGIGLSSWLVSLAAEQTLEEPELVSQLREMLFSKSKRNIIELGMFQRRNWDSVKYKLDRFQVLAQALFPLRWELFVVQRIRLRRDAF